MFEGEEEMSKEPIKRTTSRTVELLLAEIETLTRKGEELCDAYGKSLIQIHDLTAKVKRYEEALKFYANEKNEYEGVIGSPESPELWEENPIDEYSRRQYRHLAWWKYDRGEVARAALNQGKGNKDEKVYFNCNQ